MAKFWLPKATANAYFSRRQQVPDPFPSPQTNREEVVHQLWETGILVAGWWLEETNYLKDLLDKYQETQRKEAEKMLVEQQLREERAKSLPTRQQISERLRDVYSFNKAKAEGRKRVYQGSGTKQLD